MTAPSWRPAAGVEAWGRISPQADSSDLLLEQERRKGSWSEIAGGSAKRLIKAIAGDTKGTFHGLGQLDQALRKTGEGLEQLPIEREGKTRFRHAETGEECSAQEVLFHRFGQPCISSSSPQNGIRIIGRRSSSRRARTGAGSSCGSGR